MRTFSYKPLWKLLIDKDLNNDTFMKKVNISKSTFYKLKQNKNITTDILLRICNVLDCDITDIIECKIEKDED